jgi:hypothetical protein
MKVKRRRMTGIPAEHASTSRLFDKKLLDLAPPTRDGFGPAFHASEPALGWDNCVFRESVPRTPDLCMPPP